LLELIGSRFLARLFSLPRDFVRSELDQPWKPFGQKRLGRGSKNGNAESQKDEVSHIVRNRSVQTVATLPSGTDLLGRMAVKRSGSLDGNEPNGRHGKIGAISYHPKQESKSD
jgi:hypothetical protein